MVGLVWGPTLVWITTEGSLTYLEGKRKTLEKLRVKAQVDGS